MPSTVHGGNLVVSCGGCNGSLREAVSSRLLKTFTGCGHKGGGIIGAGCAGGGFLGSFGVLCVRILHFSEQNVIPMATGCGHFSRRQVGVDGAFVSGGAFFGGAFFGGCSSFGTASFGTEGVRGCVLIFFEETDGFVPAESALLVDGGK